jgi:hypothetical protein
VPFWAICTQDNAFKSEGRLAAESSATLRNGCVDGADDFKMLLLLAGGRVLVVVLTDGAFEAS